jgi:hypothetical protein
VQVVVSSTWRLFPPLLESLEKLLRKSGVSIAGCTPSLEMSLHERGDEIQAWLDGHPEVTRFVILDDHADMAHLGAHLVQTDSVTGLTKDLAEEAIRRLKAE